MQYLGGKFKLAKQLAAPILAERRGRAIWEPFCGGLGMSHAWLGGQLLLSDIHPALISLYRGIQNGWNPPENVTEDEYRNARTLPDTDPLKAFVGFGCSFSGRYFSKYAKGYDKGRTGRAWNYAQQAARSLKKTFATFTATEFAVVDFLTVVPFPVSGIIYCDPPYRGTSGYTTGAFDYDRFVSRVSQWANAGATVFVSEFDFPIGTCVLEIDRARYVGNRGTAVDRLYRVSA